MSTVTMANDPGHSTHATGPENGGKIRHVSVKFSPFPEPLNSISLEERIRALLSVILSTGSNQVLPLDPSSTAPTLSSIADLSVTTDTSPYLPHSSGTKDDETVGKLKVNTTEKNMFSFKTPLKPTLDQLAIYLNSSTISTGTADVEVGWLFKSVPRFFNSDAITKEFALLTNTNKKSFSLEKRVKTFGKVSAEVMVILCAKELEEAFTSTVLKTFNSARSKMSPELANLTFVPRILQHVNQVSCITAHNEYLKELKYVYIQNLRSIDIDLQIADHPDLTIRDAISASHINVTSICQSRNTNGPVLYVVFNDPTGYEKMDGLVAFIKDNATTAIYHDVGSPLAFGTNSTNYVLKAKNKRFKPTAPIQSPEMVTLLASLVSTFPALAPSPQSRQHSISNPTTYAAALLSKQTSSQPNVRLTQKSSSLQTALSNSPTALLTLPPTVTTQPPMSPPNAVSPPLPPTNPSTPAIEMLQKQVATLELNMHLILAELRSLKAQLTTTIHSPIEITNTTSPALPPNSDLSTPMELSSTEDEDTRMSDNKRTHEHLTRNTDSPINTSNKQIVPHPTTTGTNTSTYSPSLPAQTAEHREGIN